MNKKAFTLIELVVSIAIAVTITGALYLSLNASLESWEYTKNQLALQKILNEVTGRITNGTITEFGLKDGLEILAAGKNRIEFVPPWTDDTHVTTDSNFLYLLNSRIKPAAGDPIAEVKLPESTTRLFVPVETVETETAEFSRVRLKEIVPPGKDLRFTYYPDVESNPDAMTYTWWDSEEQEIFADYRGEISDISKNPFGVKITKMEFRYYDKTNNLITEFDWVDEKDLYRITGIEMFIEAELRQYKISTLSFISLHNVPLRSGHIFLSEGTKVPIPDSEHIHTLYLKNITGVSNEDVLKLTAQPESGKAWSIKIVFSRFGSAEAKIERYIIEYPSGETVFTEYPRTGVGVGLNLLALGSNGRYDYDYDGENTDDIVLVKGDVLLEVGRMDVEGVGLFLRP